MDHLEPVKETLHQLSALQLGAAVVVTALLLIGLRLILKKPPSHLTAYNGEAGSVLVSRKALQELVRAACLLDEGVEAARPVIRVKNDKITARVELRLTKADSLKAVCQRVQDHITSLLHKSLSFDQIGTIEIVVKSFGTEPESPRPQVGNSPDTNTQLASVKTNSLSAKLPPKAPVESTKDFPTN